MLILILEPEKSYLKSTLKMLANVGINEFSVSIKERTPKDTRLTDQYKEC